MGFESNEQVHSQGTKKRKSLRNKGMIEKDLEVFMQQCKELVDNIEDNLEHFLEVLETQELKIANFKDDYAVLSDDGILKDICEILRKSIKSLKKEIRSNEGTVK